MADNKRKGGYPDPVYIEGVDSGVTVPIDKTGLATEATLSSVDSKLPATLGQKTKATALGVTLASDEDPISTTFDSNAVLSVKYADSPNLNPFGGVRVSQDTIQFESKRLSAEIVDQFWSNQEVSGSGTSTAFNVNKATTTLSVSATTAGVRENQTKRSFNYPAGAGIKTFITFNNMDTATGNKKWAGYGNGDNGLFFRHNGGTAEFYILSNVSGTPTETEVFTQANWNLDTMDGNGASGVTLDFEKGQILIIDFEWLSLGRIRWGWVIGGQIIYAHEYSAENTEIDPWASSPNLPVQYGISNDGTGAADSMGAICCAVISEGGNSSDLGVTRYASTNGTHVDANVANTIYAVVGIRLKSTHLYLTSAIEKISMISETNDDFEWILFFNPTVAGTFTYSDLSGSCMQVARGATANTVTGGIALDGNFSKSSSSIEASVKNAQVLGAEIDGTRDTMVLCVRPLSANADIQGSITWKELI